MLLRGLTDLLQQKFRYYYSYSFFKMAQILQYPPLISYFVSNFWIHSQILLNNIQILNLPLILRNQHLDDDTLKTFIENKYISSETDFLIMIQTQQLTDSFLTKYQQELNWSWISCYQVLSEETIRKFKEHVDWSFISLKQLLSVDFILEFHDNIDWFTIMKNPFLRLDFIPRCQQYLDWDSVSLYMTLNIPLLKQYQDRLNWDLISSERILTENKILQFEDQLNFKLLLKNKKQQQAFPYYSEKIIDILNPHFDNYKVYHQHARVIQNKWRDLQLN